MQGERERLKECRREPAITSHLSEKTCKSQATGGLLVNLHFVYGFALPGLDG